MGKYYPWPKSRLFHKAAKHPNVKVASLITGAGYGKTYALVAEVIDQVLRFGHGKEGANQPYLALMVEPTISMVEDVLIPIWFQFWPRKKTAKWLISKKILVATNGAIVLFRSAYTEREIDRWRGTRPNIIGLDEIREIDEYAFTLALNRVSRRQGKVLCVSTPNGFDWSYNKIEVPARERNDFYCGRATAYDNPTYDEKTLDEQLSLIGEDFYAQEVKGERIAFSGRVYKSFDHDRHIDSVGYQPDYPLMIGMDFNVDPMSAFMAHPLGANGWQIFDEIILRNSDTDQMCEEIQARFFQHQGPIVFYPDPTGGARRSSSRGRSDHSIIREWFPDAIIRARPPGTPAVRDRIVAVNRLLRKGADNPIDTRFIIDPRCKTLIQGLEQVQWKKNEPSEQEFFGHITAALGYMEEYVHPVGSQGLSEVKFDPHAKQIDY